MLYVTGEVSEIPWEANFFTQAISSGVRLLLAEPAAGLKEIYRGCFGLAASCGV